MPDYFQTMNARPEKLYRKTGYMEFTDKDGVVYATGEEPPPGYRWQGVRKPLDGPTQEIYVLVGEYE